MSVSPSRSLAPGRRTAAGGAAPRLRWPTAAAVSVYAASVVLVTVLAALGALPRWPGLLHLVSLPPLDLFTDVRWLLAHATDHPWFGIGLVVAFVVRTAVLALLAGDAGAPRWRLAFGVQGIALLPALLAALADFVAHAALYSRLFGANLIIVAVTFVVLAGVPWQTDSPIRAALRANLRAGLRAAELALYVVALLALGAVASWTGAVGAVALVPVSGLLTLVAVARLRAPPPDRPLAWFGGVAAIVALVGVTVVVTRGEPWIMSEDDRSGSILLMSGINSASGEGSIFELRPERLGYTCDQVHYFSYAGTGDGQPQGDATCPKRTGAPYEPEHTQRAFAEQIDLLAAQTEGLVPPVVVFAHSQAAWVAWQAAADDRLDGVEQLVLVGPFPSSPVGFPEPGEAGMGRVGGDLFRLLEPVLDLAEFDFIVDAPLTHELLADPDAASDVFSQPLPDDVEALAVTTVPDLALMPDGWRVDGATDGCPLREAHPYLPITPGFYRLVDDHLGGRPVDDCGSLPELYRLVALPFGTPAHDR